MATQLKTQDLEKPLVESGIRSVNFFNGRLLTANDLRREQEARHTVDRWLGQAAGDGVAYGLEVRKHAQSTAQEPLVTVEAGLAVNRDGQALQLRSQTTVALVRKSKLAAVDDASFARCGNLQSGTYIAGPGVYLLTIAPARTQEGKAPTTGFDAFGGKCNTDAIVETVQFRLISLESQLADVDFTNEDKLRNEVAYRCFGVNELAWFRTIPLGIDSRKYGLLDSIADTVLTPCDVPLAILYWTLSGGIRFVDMWSVRRRLTQRAASDWAWLADERRQSDGRAMFLQFADHIGRVLAPDVDALSVKASEHFSYLPAAGLLPVQRLTGQGGVKPEVFFDGLTRRGPLYMEGARLEALIRGSFAYPPINLSTGELMWLYYVRENAVYVDANPGNPPAAVLVFASGHMPYAGEPRFNLARWDYSNYALG